MSYFIRRFSFPGFESLDHSTFTNSDTPTLNMLNENNQASAVSIKLPEFWTHLPKLWFQKAEAQFALRGITSETTRYHHVLCVIPEQAALKVSNLIETPGSNPYTDLKEGLIKAYTLTEEQKIRELLRDSELGSRTPSEFFRELKTMIGSTNTISDAFLLTVWEERLPPQVSAVLKVADHTDATKLTEIADKVYETCRHNSINSVSSHTQSDPLYRELLEQNKKLLAAIYELKGGQSNDTGRGRSKSRNGSRSRNRSSSRPANWNDKFCFYHNKFKDQARKCKEPCAYTTPASTSKEN